MDHSLIDSQLLQEQQILIVDQLYSRGFNHFKISTIIMLIYSIIKVVALPIVFFVSNNVQGQLLAWMITMFCLSMGQIINYYRMFSLTSDQYYFLLIAEKMRHAAFYFRNQMDEQAIRTRVHPNMTNYLNPLDRINDRQLRMLALEIKFHLINQKLSVNIPSRLFFFIYQGLHVWGFIIFYSVNDDKYQPAHHLLIVIIFLGTYQYLEFYSLILIILLAGPFFLIYSGIKYGLNKRRKSRITKALQGCKFNPNKLKGQLSCKICMQEYKQQQIIIVLPCNQLHHFHKICVSQWIKISDTCPLCRKQIQS